MFYFVKHAPDSICNIRIICPCLPEKFSDDRYEAALVDVPFDYLYHLSQANGEPNQIIFPFYYIYFITYAHARTRTHVYHVFYCIISCFHYALRKLYFH